MHPSRRALRASALAAPLLLSMVASSIAQDEPQIFNAFATVEAEGTIVRAADKQYFVTGTLTGRFYVETAEGPVDGGFVTCAASARLDMATARTDGQGACTFTAHDGATAFGDWRCEGYQLVGCRGVFRLAGGTGRFDGAVGQSTFVWRPNAQEMRARMEDSTIDGAAGLLLWRDFEVSRKK